MELNSEKDLFLSENITLDLKKKSMKEYSERFIEIPKTGDPSLFVDQLEKVAEKMAEENWNFVNTHVDELMEKICLCFERDLNENEK